ncbi:MAG: cell wall-binding protein [Desulfosporosinus sp. BRH_c37]|nr:MAG: cell wall-binding protein [Desulfosporosinus sp. BRH_c37]
MRKFNLKLMTLVLCLLSLALIFPKNTLALNTPATPTNFTATVVSTNQIYLTWDSVSYATYYYVYRATSPLGDYTIVAVPTTASYINTDLSANTTYYYRVKACNSAGSSSDSAIVYATTTNSNSNLSVPANLTASVVNSNQIYLTWNPVSYATYYYVYRATSLSGTYTNIATITTTNYSNLGLSPNITYYYKVQAVNNVGSSSDSAIVFATTTNYNATLSAPTSLTATVTGTNQIYLTWNPVSYATYYYVYRATSLSGTYSVIGVPTTASYINTDLLTNTTYYYKVQAMNSAGSSSDSAIVSAITTNSSGTMPAPTSLTATVAGTNQINLTWNPVSYATYYYVSRATTPLGDYTVIAVPTMTSYSDTNLLTDTAYYYKVQAVNSTGTSLYSAIASAILTYSNGTLSIPSSLIATLTSTNQIYLTWNPVSNATYYYVYRASSSSGTYTNIATSTSTNYTDSSPSPNTTYYYKVQAMNSAGIGTFSSITYATTTESANTASSDISTQILSNRLAGEDMYETSAEVAKSGWKTSYYAIIVSGENFSDALCSAPLAQEYNAPLLLTSKDTLNAQTKIQLSRLKVKNVIIIGGTGVISSVVEQSVKNMGIEVSRIAGKDRYDTSIKIAQSMGQFDQAVIASGETFPDALSIAPIAAMKGIPILLTSKDNLTESMQAYLLKTVKSTYVVGGTGVISEDVFKLLPSPKRLSGVNRYETNISIIKEFANELDFGICYLSTGEYFADALAGSTLAALSSSPVFLVNDPVDQSTTDYFRSKISGIKQEIVFGGTAVVPESTIISLNGNTYGSNTSSAPTNVIATTMSSSQINLTWDSVSGATSYYVYGATSFSGTYSKIATVTTASYINTGLWAATNYYYKVQAVSGTGVGSYSAIANAITTSDN